MEIINRQELKTSEFMLKVRSHLAKPITFKELITQVGVPVANCDFWANVASAIAIGCGCGLIKAEFLDENGEADYRYQACGFVEVYDQPQDIAPKKREVIEDITPNPFISEREKAIMGYGVPITNASFASLPNR